MLSHNRMTNQEFTTVEANAVDMSIDALYLHELHHLEVFRKRRRDFKQETGTRKYLSVLFFKLFFSTFEDALRGVQ